MRLSHIVNALPMVAAMCALESDTRRKGGILPFRPFSVLETNTAFAFRRLQFQPSVSESNTGNRPESLDLRKAFRARVPRSMRLCAFVPGCGWQSMKAIEGPLRPGPASQVNRQHRARDFSAALT